MAVAETRNAVKARSVQEPKPRRERFTPLTFLLPAIFVILFLSLFPLVLSLYISLIRLQFVAGTIELNFVGLTNYTKLLTGVNQKDFLGVFGKPDLQGWLVIGILAVLLFYWLARYARGARVTLTGLVGRVILSFFVVSLGFLTVFTLSEGGRPGTLWVTLLYVYVGIAVQYVLGMVLAYLCAQHFSFRGFFRVVFLLPMMITPVGVAYMFRMITDTTVGPLYPLWAGLGLQDYSWINNPWSARAAIMVVDIWQWTPFMFIVLLAALESLPPEPMEAAVVDGANRWQIFREITLPALLPVSTALILIRMIEAFKIVDLPVTMTGGGPGTSTQSMTMEGLFLWRSLDIGGSAAIAYLLLFIVTILATAYGQIVRNRVTADY